MALIDELLNEINGEESARIDRQGSRNSLEILFEREEEEEMASSSESSSGGGSRRQHFLQNLIDDDVATDGNSSSDDEGVPTASRRQVLAQDSYVFFPFSLIDLNFLPSGSLLRND